MKQRYQFRHASGKHVSVTAGSELEARERAVTALQLRGDAGLGEVIDPARLELVQPQNEIKETA